MPRVRVRTGCLQCRQRRKKCDEGKPNCATCTRLGLICEFGDTGFRFVHQSTSLNDRKSLKPSLDARPLLPLNVTGSHGDQSLKFSGLVSPGGAVADRIAHGQDVLPDARRTVLGESVANCQWSTVKLWFSSFVDFTNPTTSSSTGHSLDEIGTGFKTQDDGFFKLQETLYLRHWRQNVVPELPDAYKRIEDLVNGCSALRSTIIALSACDLAQTRVEVRFCGVGQSARWDYGINREHERDARNWYSKATCELGRLEYEKQDKIAVFATLLLFVQIESHIGTFRGAAFHHHGIEHIFESDINIWKNPIGKRLITSWVSARSQNWSCRVPFTLLGFEDTLKTLSVNVDQALDPSEARDEAVTVIMLQSWYLSVMILFERYAGRGDMETINSRCVRDIQQRMQRTPNIGEWSPKDYIPDQDYSDLLQQQRVKLNRWLASLPRSQLPKELNSAESEVYQSPELGTSLYSPSCLTFHSQRAAVNYTYYIVARILQSREILDEYLTMGVSENNAGKVSIEANYWLGMLRMVVESLDVSECVRYCTYAVGLFQVVRMCQLRLPRHAATICSISKCLVKTFTENCIPDDGHVRVSNYEHEFGEIEQQRVQGKDLFYIMPRYSPDTATKANPPDFRTLPAVVYGRDRASGKLFCKMLPSSI